MHVFKLPIGDWSDDGHGKCDYYTVESNMSVEEVREIHFKIEEETGVDIHKICNKYEQDSIPADSHLITMLKEEGKLEKMNVSGYDGDIDGYYTNSRSLALIWVYLLQKTEPKLKLKLLEEPEMLSFYGFDKQGRHISFVGYGTL